MPVAAILKESGDRGNTVGTSPRDESVPSLMICQSLLKTIGTKISPLGEKRA